MKEKNSNRTRIIAMRLTPHEYSQLHKKWKSSTCRKLSEYVRARVFSRPVVATYRNQSLDEFMTEAIRLKQELNAIGNNFNQSVKKLHTLQQIAEFRSWLIAHEVEKKTLFSKVDEVKKLLQKVSESWLQ